MNAKSSKKDSGLDMVGDALTGNVRAIARLISMAEAAKPESLEVMAEVFRNTGSAHVIGLTGVPGSGKSTLVRGLAEAIRAGGRKVGIVAIDPSSPFSGGAILGDRIRMTVYQYGLQGGILDPFRDQEGTGRGDLLRQGIGVYRPTEPGRV